MEQFLQALGSAGVAPFTVLLVAALLYWLMVILGALDIDILHLGHHGGHHAAGGHGGHDAGSAGHHGGHDAGSAGHHGGHHGQHDAGHDAHHDGQHGPGHGGGFLHVLSDLLAVGKVPLTITVSLLVFSGWAVAMALVLLLGLWWPLVLAGALAVAFPSTALVNWPLRAAFTVLGGGVDTGIALVGREARITSATCDATFGTATCEAAGAEVLLRVAAIRAELSFRRDDVVVIADHDAERDLYLVAAAGYRHEPALAVTTPALPPPGPPPALSAAVPVDGTPLTEAPAAGSRDAAPRPRPTARQ